MSDIVTGLLLLFGGLFSAVAGIGLLRLPDVLIRMHASTKAGTLGVGLIVLGVAAHFSGDDNGGLVIAKALLIVVFLLLTAPVGAHLIGRAAYRSGTPLWEGTVIDERDRMALTPDGTTSAKAASATPSAPSSTEPPPSEQPTTP